jgi:hypothetical protein
MSLLDVYILLTLLALLWIAYDVETIYIFDVFGKNFHYVWFDSGQRWTHLFTYGWRLAVICTFVLLNGVLSYRFYAANPFQLGPSLHVIVAAIMLVASFAAIPWIYVAHRLRWQRRIHWTASQLSEFITRITAAPDLEHTLQRADYDTDAPWTAWHPNQKDWQSDADRDLWSGLVPVVYVRNAPPRAALFPIDWEMFLAWNVPIEVSEVNKNLPIHGPCDSSFCVESVKQVRGCPNWSLITTEIQSELDAAFEHSGSKR